MQPPQHGPRFRFLLACLALVLLLGGVGRTSAQAPEKGLLPWKHDLQKALEAARKENRRVFIDFTGQFCPPCEANEKNVFPLPEVKERLLRYELVKLYTDQVPNDLYPPEVRKALGDSTERQEADARPNAELMARLGGKAAPFYAVVEPTREGFEKVADYGKGLIKGDEVKGFVEFLNRGLAVRREALPTRDTTQPVVGTERARDLVELRASVTPDVVQPGQTVTLTVTGTPKPGHWTYPVTQHTRDQERGQLSRWRVVKSAIFKPLEPFTESSPAFALDATDKIILKHKDRFTWSQEFLVPRDARTGTADLSVKIWFVACNEQTCTAPDEVTLSVPVQIKGEPVATPPAVLGKVSEQPPPVAVADVPPEVEKELRGGLSKAGGDEGLLAFILQGVFWGAISLVTPCVFPMIPITVTFFLKQSERENHRPLLMALVYSATIIIVLTIAAVALLSVFRALSVHPLMNFGLGALFVFFALSLLGMYDIELPAGLARFTSSREGQGIAGTIFMALTFTIISFACVAPFLGGFGGTAATANMGFTKILLGGLAFAVTFAAPFTVLALFPSLLKKMPKSGTWLNSVKVVMGFLELAAALKFFRTGELLVTAEPTFFTYDTVLALYVALSFLCGLYLLCFFRLPHDTPVEHIGVIRMLFAALFIGLGFYLLPATWKNDKGVSQRPSGVVFAWLDSFLLPDPVEDLPWRRSLPKALAVAQDKGQRVFVDFTGETCTNCKFNERNIFTKREVRDLLDQYVLVALYTDKVPNKLYSAKERREFGGSITQQTQEARENLKFQRNQFNTEQLPLYVILQPTGDGGFREIARYAEGKINDAAAFAEFLSENLPASQKNK